MAGKHDWQTMWDCGPRLSMGTELRGSAGKLSLMRTLYSYQSSAKSLGIDVGDGQRDDVNTRCLQGISKFNLQKLNIETRIELS